VICSGAYERVDLDQAYLNAARDKSVLLWYNAALDHNRITTISVGPDPSHKHGMGSNVFAFEKLVYQERKEYSV
jgi:hypothetical protein